MSISDRRQAELEARSSFGSTIGVATALGILLAFSQPTIPSALVSERRRVTLGGMAGTSGEVISLMITETDLFTQINRIYDDLLKSQVELDFDAKRILYSRLWDLYS